MVEERSLFSRSGKLDEIIQKVKEYRVTVRAITCAKCAADSNEWLEENMEMECREKHNATCILAKNDHAP